MYNEIEPNHDKCDLDFLEVSMSYLLFFSFILGNFIIEPLHVISNNVVNWQM